MRCSAASTLSAALRPCVPHGLRALTERDAALTPVPLAISEAFAAGRAGVECIVLPHNYDHFSPLATRERAQRRRITADAERGHETPRDINRSLNRLVNPVGPP
jgi:hypothetical protein